MLGAAQGGLPYVNMKSFLKGGGFNHAGTKEYAGAYRRDDLVGERDLLIANTDVTAGDIVGAPALLPGELFGEDVLYSHHVTRLRLDDELWVPFVFHLLCLPQYRSHMQSIARGTTVLMLDMKALKDVPVRAPAGTAEQRRIVEILDTLDEAIRKTEQVIAKLQQMKQGLLHDLLTRGIDEHGELRDPERHPERFKDSPLGRIPGGWEVRQMPRCFVKVSPGPRQDQHSCVPNGRTPVLDQSESGFMGYADVEPGVLASPGTPVVTFANHTCAVRWVTFPCSAIQNVFFMRGASGIEDRFLYYAVDGRVPQQAYQGHWPLLQEVYIGVPPPPEQSGIADVLDGWERRVEGERQAVQKLRTLKHGLMDDLLTGHVRVTIPDEVAS